MAYGHRRMLDDDGEPASPGPGLNTARKRKYYVKDLDRGVEWMRLQIHQEMHSEESVSPQPSVPYEHKGRNHKRRLYKRTKRLEQAQADSTN